MLQLDNTPKKIPIAKITSEELAELKSLFMIAFSSSRFSMDEISGLQQQYFDMNNLNTFYDGLGDKYQFDSKRAKTSFQTGEVFYNE